MNVLQKMLEEEIEKQYELPIISAQIIKDRLGKRGV